MSDPFLRDLVPGETSGAQFAVLQRWVKQAVINAGISIPMSDPFLRDLNPNETEGARYTVLQRWLTLLADNISGGGGGGINWVTPPATSGSAGTAGQIARDASYLYVCDTTNHWLRCAISDWS